MEIVLKNTKSNIKKLNSLGIGFFTFEERYQKHLTDHKKLKPGLKTREWFSLDYDTELFILKNCLFILIDSLSDIEGGGLNIIEICA